MKTKLIPIASILAGSLIADLTSATWTPTVLILIGVVFLFRDTLIRLVKEIDRDNRAG